MMGSNDKPQDELFYAFNLDEIVPQDHLLRDIDRILDLSKLREHLAPYYSHTGRPSVDPELMIRMLLIGYRPETDVEIGINSYECCLSFIGSPSRLRQLRLPKCPAVQKYYKETQVHLRVRRSDWELTRE